MWDFSVLRSIELVARTWPFTVLRLLVWGAILLATLAAVTVGAGLGWGVGLVGSADFRQEAMLWGGVGGFAVVFVGLWTLREYLLYLVTAGHVAAMVAVADGHAPPSGVAQIRFALAQVKARFGEIHLLWVLDRAVKGAVGAVVGLLEGIDLLVGGGLDGPVRLVRTVLRLATTFLDELVLAREIRLASTDPWTTAREAIVLYAQNAGLVFKNAVWLMVLRWAAAIVVFVVALGPAATAVWIVPGPSSGWALLLSLILAIGLQRALIDPFCIASLMQVWERDIEGQMPDPVWDERLAAASRPFREITEKARAAFAGRTA